MKLYFSKECILCGEKTKIGLIFIDKKKPICKKCIKFIKKLKMRELLE